MGRVRVGPGSLGSCNPAVSGALVEPGIVGPFISLFLNVVPLFSEILQRKKNREPQNAIEIE